jgi:hypothetical protein
MAATDSGRFGSAGEITMPVIGRAMLGNWSVSTDFEKSETRVRGA